MHTAESPVARTISGQGAATFARKAKEAGARRTAPGFKSPWRDFRGARVVKADPPPEHQHSPVRNGEHTSHLRKF